MRIHTTLISVAAALLLAACGSSTSASKSNFAKAIDVPLAKACLKLDPTDVTGMLLSGHIYPLEMPTNQAGIAVSAAQAAEWNTRNFGAFDALVKAGLLTSADAQVKEPYGAKKVPGKIYSLTAAGKKALQRPEWVSFCAGTYKVDEVVNFTVPGNEMGQTYSQANFTYTPTNVASWATSDAVKSAYPEFSKSLEAAKTQPLKGRADMVLMNDGWKAHIDTLNAQ